MPPFTALPLQAPLLRALEFLEFKEMTPVQEHALPPILAGKDLTAQARTGSGKTVAFGLGALSTVDVTKQAVQALVLCPTRELADQVSAELRRLARFIPNFKIVTLCGGVPCRTQAPSLVHPPQLVVGTPGRILDHLTRGNLTLDALKVLVLDEADRMLDMGFSEEIAAVVGHAPKERQTLLFSATFPNEIRAMSKRMQRDPAQVTVDATHSAEEIEEVFFDVEPDDKMNALTLILMGEKPESALIFCHTRNDTRDVAAELKQRGFAVLALHGELEQHERDQVLVQFVNKSCSFLVATDVAARGIDVKGLPAVISWELPTDPDIHVHRIGRTGRAGQKGRAFHLCSAREQERALLIGERREQPLQWGKLEALKARATGKPAPAPNVTLVINGGKQDKLRAGDLLGALTGDIGLAGDDVGKIEITPTRTYVAIARAKSERALQGLKNGKIKGRSFKVSVLR